MGFLKRLLRAPSDELPHDDVELESRLPAAVGGRELLHWSVRGERALAADGRELSAADRAGATEWLASLGLVLDDVSKAIAGRATPSDPPYLVIAWRFGNRPATEMPLDMAVDVKGLDGWEDLELGGHTVARGTAGMLQQTSHLRGRPYVVRSGAVQFTIATDDERWADDVCRQLPGSPTRAH